MWILVDEKFGAVAKFDLSVRIGDDFLLFAVVLGGDGRGLV